MFGDTKDYERSLVCSITLILQAAEAVLTRTEIAFDTCQGASTFFTWRRARSSSCCCRSSRLQSVKRSRCAATIILTSTATRGPTISPILPLKRVTTVPWQSADSVWCSMFASGRCPYVDPWAASSRVVSCYSIF